MVVSVETVIFVAERAKAKYDSVKALKPECRKARNVVETVVDVCVKIQRELEGRSPPPGVTNPLQSLHKGVVELDEILTVCREKPVKAGIFSQTYIVKLRAATSGIHDAMTLLGGAHTGLSLEIQRNVAAARIELTAALDAIRSIRDDLGRDLRDVAHSLDLLVATLKQQGLVKDDDDARRQLQEVQAERKSLVAQKAFDQQQLLDAVCALSLKEMIIPPPPPPPPPEVPDEYKCPMTLDVMTEPVTLFTDAGRCFEREAIDHWLALHPNKDPMTGLVHDHPLEYAPNRPLRDAIHRWRGTTGGGGDLDRQKFDTESPGPAKLESRSTLNEAKLDVPDLVAPQINIMDDRIASSADPGDGTAPMDDSYPSSGDSEHTPVDDRIASSGDDDNTPVVIFDASKAEGCYCFCPTEDLLSSCCGCHVVSVRKLNDDRLNVAQCMLCFFCIIPRGCTCPCSSNAIYDRWERTNDFFGVGADFDCLECCCSCDYDTPDIITIVDRALTWKEALCNPTRDGLVWGNELNGPLCCLWRCGPPCC